MTRAVYRRPRGRAEVRALRTAACLLALVADVDRAHAQESAPPETPTQTVPHVATVLRSSGGYAVVVPVPGANLFEGDRVYVVDGTSEVELELRYRTAEGFLATVHGHDAVPPGSLAFAQHTRPRARFDGRGRTPTRAVPAAPGNHVRVWALAGTVSTFVGVLGSAGVAYRRDVWEAFGELRPSHFRRSDDPSQPDIVSTSGVLGVAFAPRIGSVGIGLSLFTNPHDPVDETWRSVDARLGVMTRARIGAPDGVNLGLEFVFGPGAPETYGPASMWGVGFGFPLSESTTFAFEASGYTRLRTMLIEGRIRQRVTSPSFTTPVYVFVAPGCVAAPYWSVDWGRESQWAFSVRAGVEVRIPQ